MITNSKTLNIRRRAGVILVFVLMMLTVCAALSGQIASSVLRLIGQAASAQREAQERWALVSIRRACLEFAPNLINPAVTSENTDVVIEPTSIDLPEQKTPQQTFRSLSFRLGPDRYDVVIQDESAKVPIHKLLSSAPQEQVKPVIRQLAGGSVRIRSVVPRNPIHWNDVFQPSSNTRSHLDAHHESLKNLTLWTDGKMNINVCSPESLDALWQWKFSSSPPDYLLPMMKKNGSNNVEDALARYGMKDSERNFVREWLSTFSNTYSMSVVAYRRSEDYNRRYTFVKRGITGFAEEHFGFHDP